MLKVLLRVRFSNYQSIVAPTDTVEWHHSLHFSSSGSPTFKWDVVGYAYSPQCLIYMLIALKFIYLISIQYFSLNRGKASSSDNTIL